MKKHAWNFNISCACISCLELNPAEESRLGCPDMKVRFAVDSVKVVCCLHLSRGCTFQCMYSTGKKCYSLDAMFCEMSVHILSL